MTISVQFDFKMSLTAETVETAFKSAISGMTFKLDIAPLQVDLSNKFQMTQVYKTWIKHFDRLISAQANRSNKDKANILLISSYHRKVM